MLPPGGSTEHGGPAERRRDRERELTGHARRAADVRRVLLQQGGHRAAHQVHGAGARPAPGAWTGRGAGEAAALGGWTDDSAGW